MENTLYSIDGKIVPESEALIPVTDRGFLYGDGLFETLHAYGQTIFRFDAHLKRLAHGASELHFNPPPDLKQLKRWTHELVAHAKFPEANVRLTVTRGSGPRGPSIKGPLAQRVILTITKFDRPPEVRFTQGVTAIVGSFRRQESAATAKLKTLNYIEQILAKREADEVGVDEAILLNNAGVVCEGSASNIALVRDGILRVPDPERVGALPGIAMLTAIEAAKSLKIPVSLTLLSPWDLHQSDEGFLSGSMRELTPLVQVNGRAVGTGKPGEITRKIIQRFRQIIEKETKPFKYPY
jgi:branched-chain amino acid aminotransferase